MKRRKALQLGMATVLGGLAASRAEAAEAAAEDIQEFGPAMLSVAIAGFTAYGNAAYLSTRNQAPAKQITYDLGARKPTHCIAYPSPRSAGAHAMTMSTDGKWTFSATHVPGELFRWDHATAQMSVIHRSLGNLPYSMTTAPDGMVFIGMYNPDDPENPDDPGGQVWQYHPLSGALTSLGSVTPVTGSQYARWIAADLAHVYVATTKNGVLVRRARSGGSWTVIHRISGGPSTGYNGLAIGGGKVFATTGDTVFRMNLDGTGLQAIAGGKGPGTPYFDKASGSLFVTGSTGGIYELPSEGSSLLSRGTAPLGTQHKGLTRLATGHLAGCTAVGKVWDLDPATGKYDEVDIAQTMPAAVGPEHVQSIAASGTGVLWVGGHGGIMMHNLASGGSKRFAVQGEAKAMGVSGDWLVAAMYPTTTIHGINRITGDQVDFATIGHSQYRPMDLEVEPGTGRVFIATKPNSGTMNGALTVLDPATPGSIRVVTPVLDQQAITSVDLDEGRCFVAGDIAGGAEQPDPETDLRAQVAVLDSATLRTISTFTPDAEGKSLHSIAHLNGVVYGVFSNPAGRWFAWDLATSRKIAGGVLPGWGEVVRQAGYVFAAVYADGGTSSAIYRLGPGLSTAKLRYSELGEGWYTAPQLAFRGTGLSAWTLKGTNIAQADLTV
jgi:hypothetical protein